MTMSGIVTTSPTSITQPSVDHDPISRALRAEPSTASTPTGTAVASPPTTYGNHGASDAAMRASWRRREQLRGALRSSRMGEAGRGGVRAPQASAPAGRVSAGADAAQRRPGATAVVPARSASATMRVRVGT